MARSLIYEEVIADDEGLRWRGSFGPWKSARWDEISDFYWTNIKRKPTIETPQGKLILSDAFANRAALLSLIAERALHAPARVWEVQKFRASQNFSQRFDYWTTVQKWMAPFQSLGAVCAFGLLGWDIFFDPKPTPPTSYAPGWQFDWLIAVTGFGPTAAALVTIVLITWRQRNIAYQHRDEHLELSPRGLVWQHGKRRIEATWEEVRAIHFVAGDNAQEAHFQVETQNGGFPVWRSLETVALWVQLVNQFAPQWKVELPVADPDLGDEAMTWSGRQVGSGARVFHFRTRDTRLVLWTATAFGLILIALPLLTHAMKTPDDDPSPVPWKFLAVALAALVLTLFYGWLCFARAAIWADETGLEWRMPFFKTRRVSWSEIESFGRDEGGTFLVANGKKRDLYHVSAPARQEELRQIIAQRATKATGKWDST